MWSHYNGLPSGYCTSSLGFLRTFKGNGPGIGLHQFKVFPFCCSKDDWVWFKWGSWKMFLAFLSISTPKSRRQYSLTIKEVLHWGSFQACEIWSMLMLLKQSQKNRYATILLQIHLVCFEKQQSSDVWCRHGGSVSGSVWDISINCFWQRQSGD